MEPSKVQKTWNRKQWKNAGYPLCEKSGAMASEIAALPPRNPQHVRMYNLTSACHAISNISRSRVKISTLDQLNDPFEILPAPHRKSDGTYERSLELKEWATREVGLICFSADWQSSALWGNYGDKHKGICLGFDVTISDLTRITYLEERISTKISDVKSFENVRKLLSFKSVDWKYEREWRKVILLSTTDQKNNLHFAPFNEDLKLAEVILGVDCSESVDEVRSLVARQHPEARVFKARIARQHFAVVPDEDTIPDFRGSDKVDT